MPVFIPHNKPRGVNLNYKTEEEIRRAFDEAVTKGGGRLREEDLKQTFRQLGARVPAWRAFRGLRHADADRDGAISGGELDDIIKYALSKYGPKNKKYY